MATKNPAPLVFHYHCRHCRVLVAQDGDRWFDQGGKPVCELRHLPNGKFLNGTRNTICRYCDQCLEWVDMAWQTERPPHGKTCGFKHQI
jgi:hypothetical protein